MTSTHKMLPKNQSCLSVCSYLKKLKRTQAFELCIGSNCKMMKAQKWHNYRIAKVLHLYRHIIEQQRQSKTSPIILLRCHTRRIHSFCMCTCECECITRCMHNTIPICIAACQQSSTISTFSLGVFSVFTCLILTSSSS